MKLLILGLLVFFLTSCNSKPKNEFWIYTSLYNHVIQSLEPKLKTQFPGVQFRWYTSGSENVAAKIRAELISGNPQADIVLTSDPFWYEEMKKNGEFLAYKSPATEKVPKSLKDSENFFTVVRIPVMVIAYHADSFSSETAPKSFLDLTLPRFHGKIAMASPLESGTSFTAVSLLSTKLGWDFFLKLRANDIVSTGGNSAALSRIERKERPVGIVLLENALAATRKNPKIKIVYPKEGVVPIPSPIAILEKSQRKELAKKVYDYLFSGDAQKSFIQGDMYSVFSWDEIRKTSFEWNQDLLEHKFSERENIKKQFAKLVLE